MGAVPVDEILGFRRDHQDDLDKYRVEVAQLAVSLADLEGPDRDKAMVVRAGDLAELLRQVEEAADRSWRKTARFGLAVFGMLWKLFT